MRQDPLMLRRENYARKKREKVCVVEGCYESCETGSVRCTPHKIRHNRISADCRRRKGCDDHNLTGGPV